MHGGEDEMKNVMEGILSLNVEDIMCMESMNNVNRVKERVLVHTAIIIKSAGDERTRTNQWLMTVIISSCNAMYND